MLMSIVSLTKSYGKFTALKDININIHNGLYSLIAPNGAGKTTLLRLLATLMSPDSGMIKWDGKSILELGKQYRMVLGYLPQKLGYYPHYSPEQYLQYIAIIKGLSMDIAKKRTDELLQFVELKSVAQKPMCKLSGGMVQRVGIAAALINDPKIILLDEPTAGLDPSERSSINFLFSELALDRIVILSTHIISDVEFTANEIILLKDKTIFDKGNVEQLVRRVNGKVFELEIGLSEVVSMRTKYQVIALQKSGNLQKLRFFSEQRESEQWKICEPTLEDLYLYVYGGKKNGERSDKI